MKTQNPPGYPETEVKEEMDSRNAEAVSAEETRYIKSYTHHNNQIGVLVEFESDDDYTIRTDEFLSFANEIAMHIAACNPGESTTDYKILALMDQQFVKDESVTVRDYIDKISRELQSNIRVLRYIRYSAE